MVVLTEGARWGAAIMSEGNFNVSRENGVVGNSQNIPTNSLVSRLARAADTDVTQSFAVTGNGVLTLANPAVSTRVKDGAYKVTFITAAANGGTFRVEDPLGNEIGQGTVGVAFNKEIKFTIADGATDFVVGDEFTLTVALNDNDFSIVPYNPAGTDGSEVPYGYSPYPVVTGASETKAIAMLVRDCVLNGNCIAWPAGITDAQKADAIQALANGKHVIVRY